MGHLVGYARVGSLGQSLAVQVDKLEEFSCGEIFKEKRSGPTATRPALQECLRHVRKGDTLIITQLDRLARSTLDLHRILAGLKDKNVSFKVPDQSIDTTAKEGQWMFSILASIAEFETALRAERQKEGILKARQNGVAFGRKAKLTEEQVVEMRQKRSEGVLI